MIVAPTNFQLVTALSMLGIGSLTLLLVAGVGFVLCPRRPSQAGCPWYDIFFRGYALLVLLCWYAFQWHYAIPLVLMVTFALTLCGLLAQKSWQWQLGSLRLPLLTLLFFQIIMLYCLAPALHPQWLPLLVQGNNDVFNYANHAIIAMAQSPALADTLIGTQLVPAITHDVFGATVWLILPTLFSGHPPIEATIPALVTAFALFGGVLFDLLHRGLRLSIGVATILSLFTLSNAVLFFIAFNFFLGQLLFFGIFCALIATTLDLFWIARLDFLRLFQRSLPYYFLILMVYPYLLVLSLSLHILVLMILPVRNRRIIALSLPKYWMGILTIFPITLLTALFLLVPSRFLENISQAWHTGGARPLKVLISLTMVLGKPGSDEIFGGSPWHNNTALGLVLLLALMVGYFLWKRKDRDAVPALALLIVWLAGMALYVLISLSLGPSYQLWKSATYYPLMFNAIFPAAVLLLLRNKHWFYGVVLAALAMLIIINISHVRHKNWSGATVGFRSLQAVDALLQVQSVFIDKMPFGEVMLVRQYITHKLLRPSSPSYYPFQRIDGAEISATSPLLTRCNCMYSAPEALRLAGGFVLTHTLPSLHYGEIFDFGSETCDWQVDTEELSAPESGGRWTYKARTRLSIHLAEIPRHALSLRLRVAPFLVAGILAEQQVEVRLNNYSLATARFTEATPRDWFLLLPHALLNDRHLHLELVIPTAKVARNLDPKLRDVRPLGLQLRELEIIQQGSSHA